MPLFRTATRTRSRPPTKKRKRAEATNVLSLTSGGTRVGRLFTTGMGTQNGMLIKRSVALFLPAAFQSSAASDTFFSALFRLSDLPVSADFTGLFDQYRLEKVVVRFIPMQNISAVGTGFCNSCLLTAVDLDDANAPGTQTDLQQYETYRVTHCAQPQTIAIKPRIAVGAYSGAFTSFMNTTGWIDVASPAVQHYGIKMCLTQSNSINTCQYRVEADYYVRFKSIR